MATLTTLASFNTTDGNRPLAGLIEDSAGDLFGTTENGGMNNQGTVFEITKTATGYASTPTTLINFDNTNVLTSDGALPLDPLLMDAAGNLFGTTSEGGANGATGTVFEIAKTATGYASTPSTLVRFTGATGDTPEAGLIADAAGDLFGTTLTAGANGTTAYVGTVFEIAKTASGYANAPTILAGFAAPPNGSYPNGSMPTSNLVMDAAGDLFGTTSFGATNNSGTVFEIAKTASGYAPLTTLADLSTVGVSKAPLAIDAAGDLFGTTTSGGTSNEGTVFEIAKTAGGYATPTILASFNLTNGQIPEGGLLIDGGGNLWGTTVGGGGTGNGNGEVFEIAKTATGFASTPTVVVGFNSQQANAAPTCTLFADAAGNLFGTSSYGGLSANGSDAGTVFEVTGSGFVPTTSAPNPPPTAAFTVADATTGATTMMAGQAYTGPVAGITNEFVTNTSDILNITANVANTFIEIAPSASGGYPSESGINVSVANGNNVLDAYGNSNFYTGGAGTDQFYEDARTLTQNSWSTVVNFHSGDNITIWGVTTADFNLNWIGDTFGATGSTGLTGVLVPVTAGQPEVAFTLTGFKMADATDGKLSLSFGQTPSQNGVAGSTYLTIHAV